jgi:hypothetical protein
MIRMLLIAGALAGALALTPPATADEMKSAISPSLLLNMTGPRVEPREAAYNESLRQEGPRPSSRDGEIQPDGTVRYGNVTVSVRNPCPPDSAHYAPPPLPGRRARN